MPNHIWRSFDIRGVAETEITPEFAKRFGRACASYFHQRNLFKIAVGRDTRNSGQILSSALIEGLCSAGMNVFDLGEAPTPAVYFATSGFGFDAGIIVTASHNPPEYNGFKLRLQDRPLYPNDFVELKKWFDSNSSSHKKGTVEKFNIQPIYEQNIALQNRLPTTKKVVIDAGNGITSNWAPPLFSLMGADVIPLFCTPDGNFPNHPADPTKPANLTDLQDLVLQENADLGIAFDGDGDRVGIVTSTGKMLWGDELLAILAQDIFKWKKGTVVCDVKCSLSLHDIVSSMGGKTIISPTGYPRVQQQMMKHGAILGGEQSSHICIRDNYYCFDDGLYAAARLLQIIDKLEEYESNIPRYPCTPEIRLSIDAEHRNHILSMEAPILKECSLSTIDGFRYEDQNGWMLFRLSGTENRAVFRVEARSKDAFAKWKNRAKQILQHFDVEYKW
jgi:phosphomannomutase / phosphoglucomutase